MVKQLLLCKRLFAEGSMFGERPDAVSSGLAISLFQDSVEMCVWALVKEKNITAKDGASFTANLEAVQKAGFMVQHVAKLSELNKARVGFKHYGNLPAPDEAVKFQAYVDDFLKAAFRDHFNLDFEELSLVDLVSDGQVRKRLKDAERLMQGGDFTKAVFDIAVAKAMLFGRLDRFVPKVDNNLRSADSIVGRVPELRGMKHFSYLADYLGALRETTLASLLKLPLQDYSFLRKTLPSAYQMDSGEWRIVSNGLHKHDTVICKRAVACLVNVSTRLESVI